MCESMLGHFPQGSCTVMATVPVHRVYISRYEDLNEGGIKMERHNPGPQGAKVIRKNPFQAPETWMPVAAQGRP